MRRSAENLMVMGLLALAVASAPAPVLADTLPLAELQRTARDKRAVLDHAEKAVATTHEQQATLEHRIDALKRLEADNRLPNRGELERLLRRSVEAEQNLTERQRAVDVAHDELVRWARRTTRRIDAEVKRRVPDMKRGALAQRREAARDIQRLLTFRKELETLGRRDDAGAEKWSQYVDVKIDPLDGPAELADKADFVEDTRDKFERKRAAIRTLLDDAKRERAIQRAASEFRSDLSLFDEESRSVRVPRTGASASAERTAVESPQSNDDGRFSAPPSSDPASPTTPQNGAAAPAPGFQNVDESVRTDLGAEAPRDSVTVGATAPRPTVTESAPTPTIVRGLDAQSLITLRVEDLDRQNLTPATLRKLIAELDELDRHLAAQAERLRKRARALEADEARSGEMK